MPGLFVSTQTSLVRSCHLFGGLPFGVTSWCGSDGPAQRPRTRFQHHAGGSVSSILIWFSLQIYTSAREIKVWAVPLLGSRMQVCPKRISAVEGLHLPQMIIYAWFICINSVTDVQECAPDTLQLWARRPGSLMKWKIGDTGAGMTGWLRQRRRHSHLSPG